MVVGPLRAKMRPMQLRHWALGAAAVAVIPQLLPIYPRTNPPAGPERALERHVEVHPEVAAMLDRSCRDCHSNRTRWPWYARVAPVSWLVARDVQKARAVMNFSDWSEDAGAKLDKAVGLLFASCADVNAGRMPKPEYALLHSEANLSAGEKAHFCQWASQQGARLMAIKKKAKAEAEAGGGSGR